MDTRRYRAKTTKEALSRVSRELGPDAIIISQRKVKDSEGRVWAEVIAAKRLDDYVEAEKPEMSIAVLPFSDLSPSGDQEYFCDGVAEEILNKLARVKNLKVVARTSAFKFKGEKIDIKEIGSLLGVSKVLEGGVRKAGERLRISAQLIDVADGCHIWSDSYDRKLEDVLAVQDDIALDIVGALRIELGVEEGIRLIKRYTENLEAYNLYLQGRYFGYRMYEGDLQRSIDFYRLAVESDAEYALAYSGMAEAFVFIGLWGFLPPKEAYQLALAPAKKAVEIDGALSEAHVAMAAIAFFFEWDWPKAESEFKRAIELNRDNGQAHTLYAVLLSVLGRHEEAGKSIETALRFDPLSSFAHVCNGLILFNARNFSAAEMSFKRAIELDPSYLFAYYNLTYFYNGIGEFGKAIECAEEAFKLPGSPALLKPFYALSQGMLGNKEEAERILEEFKNLSNQTYISAAHFGNIYLGLGDLDKLFEYCYKGLEERVPMMVFIGVPNWDALRGDPRFVEIMRELDLPK
jgi:adenylate cyclase